MVRAMRGYGTSDIVAFSGNGSSVSAYDWTRMHRRLRATAKDEKQTEPVANSDRIAPAFCVGETEENAAA